MVKSRVIDIDRGWKRIQTDLSKLDGAYTKVGVQQGTLHESEDDMGVKHTSELAVIAAVHEFGAPKRHIPERPFIRTGVDEARERINRRILIERDAVLIGKTTVRIALGRIGEEVQSAIQSKIDRILYPKLKEATIARRVRPSTKPLIDTGQLRQSIRHVEFIKGKEQK